MMIQQLSEMISAVCPIDGISSNGAIWFKAEATEAQKADAMSILTQNINAVSDVPSAKDLIMDSINALERESMIPRITREFMLAQAVLTASSQGIDEPTLYEMNIGYRKLKDLDDKISALRAQLP
jgi:hypothetical protein